MNADAFRYLYGYHFAENHKIRDEYIPSLSQEQFTRVVQYSHGSVCNQLVHMLSVDNTWFCELRGVDIPPSLNPAEFANRKVMFTRWDEVEQMMQAYLAGLRDDMLFTKPVPEGEDKDLLVWQVLVHVVNHGTDHRAQVLRILHDFGVKTISQDYIFYVYDHLI